MATKQQFQKLDAAENAFFSRELEVIRATPYEVQYAELKGMQLVPCPQRFPLGTQEYTYRVFDQVGRAAVSSDASDKGPRVDIKGFESTVKFKTLKDSHGISYEEIQAAMQANRNLDARKAKACAKALAVMIDDALLLGANGTGLEGTGFTGLFTLSGTEVYSTPVGLSGSKAWTAKTPDEVVADMHGMVFQVESNSKGVERCNTLVLPLSRKGLVSGTRMGDGISDTILKHFLDTNGSITQVEFSPKLDSNSAWTGARAVAYNKSPDKLEGIIATELFQLPTQEEGYEFITHCMARLAGTICPFPKSVVYASEI